MANILTTQTLTDNERNVVVRLYLQWVDTADAVTQLVDVSGLNPSARNGACTQVVVNKVTSSLEGFSASLLWDATTDVPFLNMSSGDNVQDFKGSGGLYNTEATGFTGDVNILTDGFAEVTDFGTVVVEMTKKYA